MPGFKVFLLLYIISIAVMYFLFSRGGNPPVLPGDLYIVKGSKRIYIPFGGSLILTIILYVIFTLIRGKIQ
jgi:hypothetical protein